MYNVYAGGDIMIIDLTKLKNNIEKTVELDFNYTFSEEEIKNTDLLSLSDISIIGYLYKDALDEVCISATIKGIMVLPCAITLKPVNHQFETSFEGNLNEIVKEMDRNARNVENTIDILPIIWENILIEIPLRVVSEEAKNLELQGDGWRLVTKEEETKEVNGALAKLKDLL